MAQAFKKGQRVQITGTYSGKPTGEIVKFNRSIDSYNVKGDDGYNYNCVSSDELVLLEEEKSENKVKSTVEKFRKPVADDEEIKFEVELKPGEKLKSMIKQFEEAVHETGEVSLTRDQALLLLSEIKFLQLDNEQLQNGMNAVREAIKTQDYLDKEENEHPLLKRGDKLIRKSDGKVFTYACENSFGYVHVEEMVVPVKLSDFEKEEE